MTVKKSVDASKSEGGTSESPQGDVEQVQQTVDFSSGRITTGVAYLIWIALVAANIYALATLNQGT